MDKPKQEYLYNGSYVTIHAKVEGDDELVVVKTDDGVLEVARKNNLEKKEESYTYKRAQERADELRLITQKAEENFENITEKVISAACKALSARMKMNILFGSNMKGAGWAVGIAEELEKLIKEDAKEIIEKEVK